MSGRRETPDVEGVQWMTGDTHWVLSTLPDGCVDCVVTSPPYWGMRDYGIDGQYGLEPTLADYIANLRRVFLQLHRLLTPGGTGWLNLGDGYSSTPPGRTADPMRHSSLSGHRAAGVLRASVRSAGVDRSRILPPKNLLGIPWRVAFALQDDGWILRNAIVWHKPNAMPESAQDRLSRRHELLFLLVKQARYYYFDLDPVRIPYTGDRSLARRAHQRGNRPHTIQTPWPPPATDRKYGQTGSAAAHQPGHRPQTLDLTGGQHDTTHLSTACQSWLRHTFRDRVIRVGHGSGVLVGRRWLGHDHLGRVDQGTGGSSVSSSGRPGCGEGLQVGTVGADLGEDGHCPG
jgi:DNA methylase